MDGYALHRVLRTGLRLLRDVVLGGLRRLGWSALGGAPVGLWIGTQEGAVVGLAASRPSPSSPP